MQSFFGLSSGVGVCGAPPGGAGAGADGAGEFGASATGAGEVGRFTLSERDKVGYAFEYQLVWLNFFVFRFFFQ